MTYQKIGNAMQQAHFVMCYWLRLINGMDHLLVAESPDCVLSMPEDQPTCIGQLFGGGTIEVLVSQVFAVEPDKFRITTFDGKTSKSEVLTEKQAEIKLNNATNKDGEVTGNIRSVEQIGNPDNRVSRRQNDLP